MRKQRRRRFGDRYDGKLLRRVDPFFKLIPHIMKSRVDAQVHFNDKIMIDKTEKYLQQKYEEGINISFLHVVIAGIVRTIAQKPQLNRFVIGRKIYARNEILVSLAIKKDMTEDSPETTVKMAFLPTDTLFDITSKVNKIVEENQKLETDNETDKTAKILSKIPSFVLKGVVGLFIWLDNHGKMPKVINRASPFHTSLFITDLGSLGIQPVYHHIYNFGTTSVFVAFGSKNKEKVFDKNNNIVEHKYIDLKVVADERICDGFYYAKAFRIFKRYMENPRLLETQPEAVVNDTGV